MIIITKSAKDDIPFDNWSRSHPSGVEETEVSTVGDVGLACRSIGGEVIVQLLRKRFKDEPRCAVESVL
jgi:hypothetical protein